ncbi:hypothetical protein [Burkholderia ambifaria]|uniref:hypothetical protein n=1 Tax=Burkholderia ambifaria TaxID=152480 RepID=UPI000F7FEBA1|nr:hypothetical protein [Burkholderia ambifaria]
MRDAFQRAGIRQESKPARPGRPGGKPQGPRTSRAVNLKRLASELDYDLLSAALGVSETTLRNLANDRAQAQDEQGAVHIAHKLEQAGMPHTWLDQPNARLLPDHLTSLRRMASSSDSKAAIRRANLRKVVDAFQDKLELLADALELAVPSISAILDGQLVFDDQRFGHINPRLVAGGFPDGWLEHSDAQLTPEMIHGLEALATDVIERELAELEESRAQAHVNPAPVGEPEETAVEAATPAATVTPGPAVTPSAPSAPPAPTLPPFAKSATTVPAAPAAPAAKPVRATPPAPPFARQHELPLAPINQPIEEPVMAKTPPAAKKGMPSKTAKPGSKASPPPALSASALAGLQHRSHAAKSKLRDKVGIGPKKAQPKPHAAKRTATTKTGPFVRGKDVLTKEQSLARAEALEKLLDNSRRGAKVTLWRDFLGSSLPFWGNVRHGTATFRDDLATNTEMALGLPENWLDNPSFPPTSMAAWVTDPTVPLPKPAPAAGEPAAGKATRGAASGTAAQTAQDTAHKSTASLKGAPMPRLPRAGAAATPPAAEPGVTAPAAAPTGTPVAPEAPAAAPPRRQRTTPASRQQAAAPVAEPASTPAASAAGAGAAPAFTWQPVAQPKSVAAPGPLTQALSGVLTELALEGRFTDDDALRLINFLKSAG